MKKIITTFFTICMISMSCFAQQNSSEAYFGVHYNSVSQKKAKILEFENMNGVFITNIIPNTAAEQNDFMPFDYLYQIDNQSFKSSHDFSNIVDKYKSGDEANIYFIRNGQKEMKRIVFGNEADAQPRKRNHKENPFLGIERNHDKIPAKIIGVPVDIVSNSTAKKMGMKDGDIITFINDYQIVDWTDIHIAVNMIDVNDNIKVELLRKNKTIIINSPIQSYAETKNIHQDLSETLKDMEESFSDMNIAIQNAQESSNIAIKNAKVEIENVPQEDVDAMKEDLGINMPVVQNLSIEALQIFPNPNQGIFILKFNLPNQESTIIRIYEASGKVIYENNLGEFQGDFREQININNKASGAYYLMIQQGKTSISKKVIISKI